MGEDHRVGGMPVRDQRVVMPVVLADVGAGKDPRRSEQRCELVNGSAHLPALRAGELGPTFLEEGADALDEVIRGRGLGLEALLDGELRLEVVLM